MVSIFWLWRPQSLTHTVSCYDVICRSRPPRLCRVWCRLVCLLLLRKGLKDLFERFLIYVQLWIWQHFNGKHFNCFSLVFNTHKKCPSSLKTNSFWGKTNRSGLSFINIQCSAFVRADPKSVKIYWWLNCIFYAFRIYELKSCS